MSRRCFRRWPSGRAIFAASLLVALLGRWVVGDAWRPLPPEPGPLVAGTVLVVRVIDGDTLLVRPFDAGATPGSREMRVRLLGIDTPETVKPEHAIERFGPEASAYTHARTAGKCVRLEFDHRRLDRYGRVLAYVWLDDALVNEELVRQGLARVAYFPGDSASMHTRLLKAQTAARMEQRGIWSEGAAPADLPN